MLRSGLLFFLPLLVSTAVQALEVSVEFSADAIQQMPSRPAYKAKMFVSKTAVRTESTLNNTEVIEITNAKKLTRVLLIPKDKVYLLQKSNQKKSGLSSGKTGTKPCKDLPDTTCKMLGKEKINNRQTEKWEFSVNRNGQSYRSLHWIDTERRMPVREFFPDGTVTELSILGKEKINGRNTEKWSTKMSRADGHQVTSLQWYDPELKIAIREEMQGGFVRELRNIKVGKQKKQLFEVPDGYKKVEKLPPYLMPQRPGQPPGM